MPNCLLNTSLRHCFDTHSKRTLSSNVRYCSISSVKSVHIFPQPPVDVILSNRTYQLYNTSSHANGTQTRLQSNPSIPHHTCAAEADIPHQSKLISTGQGHTHSLDFILQKYEKLFAKHKEDIGRIKGTEHHIRLHPNTPPIARRPHRASQATRDEMNRQTNKLLELGLIRHSESPFRAPATLATKADNSMRLCGDYRDLNKVTIDEKEPIPHIQDVIDRLSKAQYFTVLDMPWAYWHIPLSKDSIPLSAFATPDGHFEWLVLPFGLKNAPATFQRTIRQVLGDLYLKGVIPYFDDIIVYSEDIQSHYQLLDKIFQKLINANIKLRKEKCKFVQTQVEYLGFIISHGQQRPAPKKLKAVKEYPEPASTKEVQRFLGLAGWYRRFIPKFSRIAEPLTRLLRKGADFIWTEHQQSAFNKLKELLTSEPVIGIFDPSKPVIIHTDASGIGLGAILMQPNDENKNHVIAYHSRRFNQHEARYSAPEQEMLAVVEALEHFHVYTEGTHVDVYSDHRALQFLFSINNPSSRLYRWTVRLSPYTYTVHHRSGSTNQAADALSRAPVAMFINTSELKEAQSSLDVSEINKYDQIDGLFINRRKGLTRAIVPKSLQESVLKHYHDEYNHPGINKTQQLIFGQYWWPTAVQDITKYVRSCKTCQMVKPSNKPQLGQLQVPPTPHNPMNTWAMDTVVMGSSAKNSKAKYIQLFIDHHSRYVWAFATPKNTTATIINCLSQLFASVGKPSIIISDRGTNYTSNQFKRFLEDRRIKHRLTSSYHPQANGICEKANDTIVRALRHAVLERPIVKWSTHLSTVVDNYNRTPNSATGFTPRFLHFGEKSDSVTYQIDIDTARQLAVKRSDQMKFNRKEKHDNKHQPSNFDVGDLVLRRLPANHPSKQKLSPAFTGPYIIRNKNGPESFTIGPEDDPLTSSKAHSSQLIPFNQRV